MYKINSQITQLIENEEGISMTQNYRKNELFDVRDVLSSTWLLLIIFGLFISLTGCFLSEDAPMFFHVWGNSMNPGISDDDYLTVDPNAYDENLPERNDIVVFSPPHNPEVEMAKRIIGLPGETIIVRDGQLWIDDQLIDEPYIREPPRYTGEWLMGEQEYFVLSDNRNNGSDSHAWGALPFENIEGKVRHICKSRAIATCREIDNE